MGKQCGIGKNMSTHLLYANQVRWTQNSYPAPKRPPQPHWTQGGQVNSKEKGWLEAEGSYNSTNIQPQHSVVGSANWCLYLPISDQETWEK